MSFGASLAFFIMIHVITFLVRDMAIQFIEMQYQMMVMFKEDRDFYVHMIEKAFNTLTIFYPFMFLGMQLM